MQTASVLLMLPLPFIVSALPSDNQPATRLRRDTASAPSKTPPGAAHALRDPSKLKYEVVGIVGAYLFWLAVTIILIVFVGKRLRRRNTVHHGQPAMTMMKTFSSNKVAEVPAGMKSPGLKSPVRLPNIMSWGKKNHKANPSDYSISTVQSFESNAHEQNKAKDMDELTKLYAAVMSHDEAQSQGHNSAAHSPITDQDTSPLSPGYPPEFAHLHDVHATAQMHIGPTFNQPLHHPMAPTPTNDAFPQEARSHYDPNLASRNSARSNKSTPMSIMSDMSSRAGSVVSSRSKPSRISIRGQNISQPIGSADLRDAQYYDETVPLSPRNYTPGPPPPTPGRKKQAQVHVEPVTEDVPLRHEYEHYQQQIAEQYQLQQDIPQQFQQQLQHPQSFSPQPSYAAPSLPQSPRARNVPAALTLRSAALNNAATSAATAHPSNAPKALPFRNMYGDASLRSAPPTKTTFLERPDKVSSGPRTGVMPTTPYSPYMPNTPMTPITPRRLMNKQELKAKRKEERLQALQEDAMVENDDDMWGK